MADDVREEAERLVAAALAAASFALRGAGAGGPLAGLAERFLGGGHAPSGSPIATGTPECCVCPVCRAIAALRDPSPELALRLASGASDVASGITTILRAVNSATARPAQPRRDRPPDAGATWRAATRDENYRSVPEPAGSGSDATAGPGDAGPWAADAGDADPWHAATHPAAGAPPTGARPAPKKVAKKAVKKPAPPDDGPA
jgi:hypothetical protein